MADKKVTELPDGTSPTGDEQIMVVQSAQSKKLPARDIAKIGYQNIVDDSTTSRTLTLTDIGSFVRMTSASANSLVVPPNSTAAIQIGTVINGIQAGNGATTITAGAGVTINRPTSSTATLRGKGSPFALVKVATDTWDLFGDLGAA